MKDRASAAAVNEGLSSSRDLAEQIMLVQPRLQRALETSLPEEVRDQLAGVTIRQLEALACLPSEGSTMRQFATAVGISGAAATALADRMIKRGLATRRDDPEDRRTVWLAPTEQALALVDSFRAWQRTSMSAILGRLDETQLTTLLEVLQILSTEPGD